MRKRRRVTEMKTLLIMLYHEMAHIGHDKRAIYGHSGNTCLRSVTSSILVCYVLPGEGLHEMMTVMALDSCP